MSKHGSRFCVPEKSKMEEKKKNVEKKKMRREMVNAIGEDMGFPAS